MKRLLVLVFILVVSAAFAQQWRVSIGSPQLQGEARAALERAEALAESALNTYQRHNADFPLWRDALAEAHLAEQLAPGHPAPKRFLAEAYSITLWYIRAWDYWQAYDAAGGTMDPMADEMLARIGNQLGYLRYANNDLEGALSYYRRVAQLVPSDVEAYVWSGRVLLEANRPQEAIQYWERVLQLDPGDTRAQYFLDLARDQARWGVDAATAFYEGVRLYEAGDLVSAQQQFGLATDFNANYAAAWAWRGRTHFERGNYRDAANHYRRALALEPGNETYRYFAEESERRM